MYVRLKEVVARSMLTSTPAPAGRINLCSPDHISLLVHRTFNVSIPRHHIITDSYEFEYGPAENDPEFGAVQDEAAEGEKGHEDMDHGGGRWVHKITGTKLGDADDHLEFTVVGYDPRTLYRSLRLTAALV